MKTTLLKLTAGTLLISGIIFSCKKKDDTAPDNSTQSTTTTGGTTGSTTGGVTNTGNWNYGTGQTYSVNPTFGGVSWVNQPGREALTASDNVTLSPWHGVSFEFATQNPSTGTYTLMPDLYSAAFVGNQAMVTTQIIPSTGVSPLYAPTVSTHTVAVINNAGVITVNFSNIICTQRSTATNTLFPAQISLSGTISK